jgi:hypothetical protein
MQSLTKLFYKTQHNEKTFNRNFILWNFRCKSTIRFLNAILDRLEARKGINQNLEKVNIDNKKFVFIKDEADHTERDFIVIKGNNAYVEVFDDKATGESSSNVLQAILSEKRTSFLYGQMYWKVKNPDACYQNATAYPTGQYSLSY